MTVVVPSQFTQLVNLIGKFVVVYFHNNVPTNREVPQLLQNWFYWARNNFSKNVNQIMYKVVCYVSTTQLLIAYTILCRGRVKPQTLNIFSFKMCQPQPIDYLTKKLANYVLPKSLST